MPTTARPRGASWSSPTCCASSRRPASATPSGSRPTSITPRRTTTTPTRRPSRISSLFGNSSPARCTQAAFGPGDLDMTFGRS
jgi:hypothetical protein